jgi:hypothetical protein
MLLNPIESHAAEQEASADQLHTSHTLSHLVGTGTKSDCHAAVHDGGEQRTAANDSDDHKKHDIEILEVSILYQDGVAGADIT